MNFLSTVGNVIRLLLIIAIAIMAIPLYFFFGFGSLFAFDAPGSFNNINFIKLLVMDMTAFITPIAMIVGLILGHKLNSKYYLLTLISPILLFLSMKLFFGDF